jgi:F-type H+-transporting ATPase subunit a
VRLPRNRFGTFFVLFVCFALTSWIGATRAAEEQATDPHAEETHGAADTHGETDAHGAADAHGDETDVGDTHALGHALDEDAHGEAAHGDEHHGEEHGAHAPHLPSFLDLIIGTLPGGKEGEVGSYLYLFAPTIFGILIAIILAILTQAATRNLTLIPGRLQNFMEWAIGGLSDFVLTVIGPEGKRFVPFLGTLFIYILMMNMIGLVPLMMAPTSRIHMTVALAICVFVLVQYTALKLNGPGGYLFHLAGEPRTAAQWALVPLMLPLHLIGEIAKPFSLAVRLFGNVFGEETLIAVFVGLGAAMLAFIPVVPLGIPIHIPFVFLSILLGSIQALVFMLLSTVYLALVMPHGDHEH